MKRGLWFLIIFGLFQGALSGQAQNGYSLFYNVSYLEPNTLEPINGVYYLEGIQANELIYSRLWTWNADLAMVPDLSVGIPIGDGLMQMLKRESEGLNRWAVTLKEGLKWPDGMPITTADVKFSFELYSGPKSGFWGWKYLELIKEIRIENSSTISFICDQNVTMRVRAILPLIQILPKHKFTVPHLDRGGTFSRNPMGSGPFQLTPEKAEGAAVLKRNNNYHNWSEASNLNYVKISEDRILASVISKLTIDVRNDNWSTIDIILDIPKSPLIYENVRNRGSHLNFRVYTSNSWYGIGFNTNKPLLSNRDVRLALTKVVNVDQLLKDWYAQIETGGIVSPAALRITGPYNPLWGLGDDKIKAISFDPEGARKILNLQGVNLNRRMERRNYKGEEITLKMIFDQGRVVKGSPESQVISQIEQAFDDLLKIKLVAVGLDGKTFQSVLASKRDYDLVFIFYELGWGSNLESLFTEDSERNITNYSSSTLTTLMNNFSKTTNSKKRIEYSKQIHKHLYDNAPYIFLYRVKKLAVLRKVLRTKYNFVPRYFFTHIGEWYIEMQ